MKMYEVIVGLGGVVAFSLVSWAGPLDKAVIHGETDKESVVAYELGEEMTFTLSLQGSEPIPDDTWFVKWERTGDDGVKQGETVPLSITEPLVIRTSIDRPGFVRIEAVVVDKDGKPFRKSFVGDVTTPEGRRAMNVFEEGDKRVFFSGGAGARIEALESVDEPKDFDSFWAMRKARLSEVPMTATVKEHKSADPMVRVFSFSVACAGPRPVTGTYTLPVDVTKKYPAEIAFHGYSMSYVQSIPSSGPRDRIYMQINAHGYELEREPEYYKEFYRSISSNGLTWGLDTSWQNRSTETAYFGWMICRIIRALQYLKSLPEWDGRNLTASGGSMGGLQAVWAAGIDADVSEAKPSIPWCCDMGGRETLKRNKPDWGCGETLAMRYFDPVNFARRVNPKCRVEIVRAGLGDYVCPPSGVAILYNNLKCPKKINWIQGATHGYVPREPHQRTVLTSQW